jgi:hypothetical protein
MRTKNYRELMSALVAPDSNELNEIETTLSQISSPKGKSRVHP